MWLLRVFNLEHDKITNQSCNLVLLKHIYNELIILKNIRVFAYAKAITKKNQICGSYFERYYFE